ncbi:MAG: 4-alpha-glucanotransferase [Candidatus Methylacidiphilales bacterium]|nr:4-alpha-glucanotransferase [Candidatus Methylacidiphilales bacterium]
MPTPSSAPSRQAGLFAPVFALRHKGDLGVGDTESVRRMVDVCARWGFRVLQVLPINETSGDNSPYNAISSCALDITTLAAEPGLLPGLTPDARREVCPDDLAADLGRGPVAYAKVKAIKWQLAREAFAGFQTERADFATEGREFEVFCRDEREWLEPYALFRALMADHDDSPMWESWRPECRTLKSAMEWVAELPVVERRRLDVKCRFYQFVQWVLYRQWESVQKHAALHGVALMGDIPFGLSRSSADVWARPQQFDLEWSGGAPPEPFFQPDPFTQQWGQNWGVPLYQWAAMEADGFSWWRRRVRQTARIFKMFRIDHVLGFYRVFSFPWQPRDNARFIGMGEAEARALAGDVPRFLPRDDHSEENRQANRRDGEKILRILQEAAGDAVIVAEDLGVVPVYVRPSLLELGISGFKIPLFERDDATREYKDPADYPELTLATLSTHDHETLKGTWEGWWAKIERDWGRGVIKQGDEGLAQDAREASWEIYRLLRFAGLDDSRLVREFEPAVHQAACRQLLECPSWLAVLTVTDFFALDLRFNVPGPVSESNWSERLPFSVDELAAGKVRPDLIFGLAEWLRESGRLGRG